MHRKKLFSVNTELYKVTGVQKVMMDIHHAVQDEYEAKIVGTIPYNKVHRDHKIAGNEYVKWSNPFMFRNSIVVVHERKLLLFFWILNHLLFQNIKLVYVHHNVFHDKRLLSIMPKYVVAIADKGIENLVEYFKVPINNIVKIHNCVPDINPTKHKVCDGREIKLLCPARINSQKRQLEIVEKLTGKLDKSIKIQFAGIGPDYDKLLTLVAENENFEALGFRSDIHQLLQDCDYLLLFSGHEGLPITMIEAAMTGTPMVCSNVGGNAEICKDGLNGFVLDMNDWDGLIKVLNNLQNIHADAYLQMSESSRSIYEECFTFERFKNKYLTLLNSL